MEAYLWTDFIFFPVLSHQPTLMSFSAQISSSSEHLSFHSLLPSIKVITVKNEGISVDICPSLSQRFLWLLTEFATELRLPHGDCTAYQTLSAHTAICPVTVIYWNLKLMVSPVLKNTSSHLPKRHQNIIK